VHGRYAIGWRMMMHGRHPFLPEAGGEVCLVASKLCRLGRCDRPPREWAFLTEHKSDALRWRASRVRRELPRRIPESRLRQLLGVRPTVHQDELSAVIRRELGGRQHRCGGLALRPGDVEALVATQRTNRDKEVDVAHFLARVYHTSHETRTLDQVNDGLNRQLRQNRPPKERPSASEEPRYENYWQARCIMEDIQDSIQEVERGNGGKTRPFKIFGRLDVDGDGYLTLSDLQAACRRYKVPCSNACLHALFSALDREDNGSVNSAEFLNNFEVSDGTLLDQMQAPIKGVRHEGGTLFGGPLVNRRMAPISSSTPVLPPSRAASEHLSDCQNRCGTSSRAGSRTELARISDVVRARTLEWKSTTPPTETIRVSSAGGPARNNFGRPVCADTRPRTGHSIFAVPAYRHMQGQPIPGRHGARR